MITHSDYRNEIQKMSKPDMGEDYNGRIRYNS